VPQLQSVLCVSACVASVYISLCPPLARGWQYHKFLFLRFLSSTPISEGACGISIEDANDQFWLATSGDVEGVTGKYYVYRNERRSNSFAYDKENRRKLWEHLCDATGATY